MTLFVAECSTSFPMSHDPVTVTVTCDHHVLTLDSNKKRKEFLESRNKNENENENEMK